MQSLRAAVDPEGNAIVAWTGSFGKEGEPGVVHTAYKPAGEGWEEPVELSEEGAGGYVNDVVFNQGGNAAILWQRWDGTTWSIHAAYRPKGEAWEEPVQLSEEGRDGMDAVLVLDAPGSATAADGDATAVWVSSDPIPCPEEIKGEPCFTYVVQAAGYDPDGLPEVEVEAPEEGVVGEEIVVSTPTEGLYSPYIDFGDGSKIAGTEAVHVYDEPGTYLVKAAGAQELGYFGVGEQTLTIVGDGSGSNPDPELEGEPEPDEAGGSGSGVATVDFSAPPSPPPAGGPSQRCSEAEASRTVAARRLRNIRAKLGSAANAKSQRRLATAVRKRQAALRRARARVVSAC